tara:strand:- start:3357 stop:3605 length:249 start_codon:yes stop_codon:yes gene_type:complete
MRKYITQVQQYSNTTSVDVDTDCNDILIYNAASGVVFLDGYPIGTNASLQISGNEGEINVSKYKLSYGASVGFVYVIRKRYV